MRPRSKYMVIQTPHDPIPYLKTHLAARVLAGADVNMQLLQLPTMRIPLRAGLADRRPALDAMMHRQNALPLLPQELLSPQLRVELLMLLPLVLLRLLREGVVGQGVQAGGEGEEVGVVLWSFVWVV